MKNQKNSFLISVIIPCYNVEQYIDRCMETVVNQTIGIEQLEIILVNDASTDHTLDKLKEWEKRYPDQILVITYEENLRQGGARNIGIQYASADYIGFVDSDDWIELDMYETLYEPIRHMQYDIVRGKYVRESFPGEVTIDNTGREDQIFQFEQVEAFYRHDVNRVGKVGEYGSVATCIYLKSRIVENEVWFPEKLAYEDNYWGSILKLYIKNMYLVDKVVYHYFVNMKSTSTSRNAEHHLDRLKIEIGIIEEYKRRGAFPYFQKELEMEFIDRFYLNTLHIIFTRFDDMPDIFSYLKETLLEYFPDYKKNPNYEKLDPLRKELLGLLELEGGDLTVDELKIIKRAYLEGCGYLA